MIKFVLSVAFWNSNAAVYVTAFQMVIDTSVSLFHWIALFDQSICNFLKVVTIQRQVFLVWWTTLEDLIHTWLYNLRLLIYLLCVWLVGSDTRLYLLQRVKSWNIYLFAVLLLLWWINILFAIGCDDAFDDHFGGHAVGHYFSSIFHVNYARLVDFIVLILLEKNGQIFFKHLFVGCFF